MLTAAGHEISGPGSLAAPSAGRRLLADHTETTETNEEVEKEDAQSNADDVGLNLNLFVCQIAFFTVGM